MDDPNRISVHIPCRECGTNRFRAAQPVPLHETDAPMVCAGCGARLSVRLAGAASAPALTLDAKTVVLPEPQRADR